MDVEVVARENHVNPFKIEHSVSLLTVMQCRVAIIIMKLSAGQLDSKQWHAN